MKRLFLLLVIAVIAVPLSVAAQAPLSAGLQKLDISSGHWIYHGTSRNQRTGKTGTWTWDEHCSWSGNRQFLQCSFSNVWSGRKLESLVVDTYNPKDHSYWHYEIFTNSGTHPFASTMSVVGNTWTESTPHQKIVYVWTSPKRVEVKIEASRDGTHWTTVDQGVGIKQ